MRKKRLAPTWVPHQHFAGAPVYKVMAVTDNQKSLHFKIVVKDSEFFKIDPESGVVSVKKLFSVSSFLCKFNIK